MLSPIEDLSFVTIKISCLNENGIKIGSGTGFFFTFTDGIHHVETLVTNKHVLEDSHGIELLLTKNNGNNEPNIGNNINFRCNDIKNHTVFHPNPEIDLAIIIIPSLTDFPNSTVYYKTFNSAVIPDTNFLTRLDAIEDITMIGYPIGLMDNVNNLPIYRRGITATLPYIDHNGRPEFLIDCACFPGSSGSPVLLLNTTIFKWKDEERPRAGNRFRLLGILYAGPILDVNAKINIIRIPVSTLPNAEASVEIPINLGYVIKSSCLMDFNSLIFAK